VKSAVAFDRLKWKKPLLLSREVASDSCLTKIYPTTIRGRKQKAMKWS
jgi:hypothetical protein